MCILLTWLGIFGLFHLSLRWLTAYLITQNDLENSLAPVSFNKQFLPKYPLIVYEIIATSLLLLSLYSAFNLAQAMVVLVFSWLLLCLSYCDLRWYLLPNFLTYSVALFGISCGQFLDPQLSFETRLVSGFVALIFFYGLQFIYRFWRGVEGLGGGDIKLFAGLGCWFDCQWLPLLLVLACLFALCHYLLMLFLVENAISINVLPFGIDLCSAAWLLIILRLRLIELPLFEYLLYS